MPIGMKSIQYKMFVMMSHVCNSRTRGSLLDFYEDSYPQFRFRPNALMSRALLMIRIVIGLASVPGVIVGFV